MINDRDVKNDMPEPNCGNCMWAKVSHLPRPHDQRGGKPFGLAVSIGPWLGFSFGDRHMNGIGAFYCEHYDKPRGLVLANYTCHNHQRDTTIDQVEGPAQITGTVTGRLGR